MSLMLLLSLPVLPQRGFYWNHCPEGPRGLCGEGGGREGRREKRESIKNMGVNVERFTS